MTEEKLTPLKIDPLVGTERFVGLDAQVSDFWRFAIPDLRVNNVRGWLAEYLIWRALGVERPVRIEWDAYDVEWNGIRIEVKSSGYLQVWQQDKLSELKFTGLAARYWGTDGTPLADTATNNADVYAFAVHLATTHDEYDPLDLRHWHFAVLSKAAVAATGQRSLTWARVLQLSGGTVAWADIQDAVRRAATNQL